MFCEHSSLMEGVNMEPLGEPKPRLPFKQKIKQLQRPWRQFHTTKPPIIWATSKQAKREKPGVRPWSGGVGPSSKRNLLKDETGGNSGCSTNSQRLSRGRPTTVTFSPSSIPGNPRAWESFRSLFNGSAIGETQSDLRLDGVKVSTKNASERAARVWASSNCRYLDGGVEEQEQPLGSTTEESPSSFRCAPSFCSPIAAEEAATGGSAHYPKSYVGTILEDLADPHGREDNNSDTQREPAMRTTLDSSNNSTNAIEGTSDNSQLRVSSTRGTFSSNAIIPGNTTPSRVTSSERGPIPVSNRGGFCGGANGQVGPDPDIIEVPDESDLEGSRQVDSRPLIGDRDSVELMLLQPGKGKGTRHREGSITKGEEGVPREQAKTTDTLESTVAGDGRKLGADEPSHSGEKEQTRCRKDANRQGREKPFRPLTMSVLGYYAGDDRGQGLSSPTSTFYGRALVSNIRLQSVSSRRPKTSAMVVPGRQTIGAIRPLSPTSSCLGSPSRRHRNSNWGEEGVPLALEEKKHSRRTIPYVVSGTMLGWKLSTRRQKKTLEDSLKACDYSEHHPIPVYGFRTCANEAERTAARERRLELQRVEARALAAEKAAVERRARAEGEEGSAAFARAMSRRAFARAEWIQKMGDTPDEKKENLLRRSLPEVVRAYREHVGNRAHRERLRKRAEHGLKLRHPKQIYAVTSRADIPVARKYLETRPHRTNDYAWEDSGFTGELAQEPYLMLVQARRCRGSQEDMGVPFCSGCLCRCTGICSCES